MSASCLQNDVSGPFWCPHLTALFGLTGITSAGQRHVMPVRRRVEKTTGQAGISQREEREMGIFSRPQEEVDAADDKFWALRNSGWKGPIDHNGDKVEDMEQWIRDHS